MAVSGAGDVAKLAWVLMLAPPACGKAPKPRFPPGSDECNTVSASQPHSPVDRTH